VRELIRGFLRVAVLGLLAAAPVLAQAPAEAWLERLRAERFAAAERVLAQAAVAPARAVVAASEPREDEAADGNSSAWRGRLTPEAWGFLERILAAEDVPVELLAVGWVESRFDPQALSPKGARGLWQLMPETARRYGLEVGRTRDDRTDLVRSTRAAARHLADLYAQFGDWRLALAAYNAGGGRVEAALARAGSRDFRQASRWLPRETREYVPAVLGAIGKLPPPARERGGAAGRTAAERLGGAAQARE
jgi:soluble lytic murein transglycosylase-like protein